MHIFGGKNIGKKYGRKMLMKLTPAVNFINFLSTPFLYKILAQNITKLKRT